jgi:hypothetical protein
MKAKRVLTEAQRAALVKNAAKGRKKLAQMRKLGLPIGKPKPKSKAVEIPLAMIPVGKAQPVTPAKRRFPTKEGVAAREAVDALAQLIVASWAEVQRRKGAL